MKLFYRVLFLVTVFALVFVGQTAMTFAQSTLVASVNLEHLVVVDRTEGTFTISFDITNGQRLQTGVRYAAVLRNADNTYVVDQVVYDESLTILENGKINKRISYTPPATLSGNYNLFITLSNGEGFPFGTAFVTPVQLFAKSGGITVAPESCVVEGKTIDQSVVIKKQTTLSLRCLISNGDTKAVSLTPSITTWTPDLFGISVDAPASSMVTIPAKQKQAVEVSIPVATVPGLHTAVGQFGDSNPVFVRYVVSGMSATVRSASLDADRYRKGTSATASIIWSVVNPTTNRVTVEATLKSGGGWQCAVPVSQIFSLGQLRPAITDLSFTIEKQCFDPIITVSLKDEKGELLDEGSFAVDTQSSPLITKTTSIVLLALLVLIAGAIVLIKRRKHMKEGESGSFQTPTMMLAFILFGGMMALFPTSVAAFSYTSGANNDVTTTITMQQNFGPGATATATAEISSTATHTVSLTAVNNIVPLPARTTLLLTGVVSPGNSLGTYDFQFQTPATNGTYSVNFETGVDENIVYVKVVEVSRDSGVLSQQTQWELGMCPGGYAATGNTSYGNYYPYDHGTYRADFYSDPSATTPLDVSGLNLKLKMEHYINIPTWISSVPGTEIDYTGILSGTSYTYTQGYDSGYTDGYGPSSCDQQVTVYGFGTLDGNDVAPTPYYLIPEMPIVNIIGPSGTFQDQDFAISWNSQYATSCIGTGFNTGGTTSGSVTLTQSTATTYTVSCSNIVGVDAASITVDDWGPAPTPPVVCNQWPGMAVQCDAPNMCDADPVHSGFEICVP